MLPYFFISYPRATGAKVIAFKEDLERIVKRRTIRNLDRRNLVTFDRDIEQGRDWQSFLSVGLSTDKVLVAVLDGPFFAKDSDCGKELTAFILRHKDLRIDRDGCLVGLTNILPVLWDKEKTIRDFSPAIVRRIEDVPAISRIKKAVKRYTEKGMERCVNRGREYYADLVDAFAEAILGMPDLDPAPIRFASLQNAFEYDWLGQFPPESSEHEVLAVEPREPLGPGALAVFYITKHPLMTSERRVSFADDVRPIDPGFGALAATSSTSAGVLGLRRTIHAAAVLEEREAFHYAFVPPVPTEPTGPVRSLAALRSRNVPTMLVIDPLLWPGQRNNPGSSAVESIVESTNWPGPVIIPALEGSLPPTAADCDSISERVTRRVLPLSGDEISMINQLRPILVAERGRVVHTATVTSPANERPPSLKGVRSSGA